MQIGTDIEYAAQLLKQGEVIAIPTETVYGLAANAFNTIAVAKIFEIKNRPYFNPLIVHVKNLEYIQSVTLNTDERLLHLMKKFSPGPLTILTEKKNIIPDIVTAGSNRVAIRIPQHKITLNLLHQLDFPLAAPSANPFQYISPTSAHQVYEQLSNKIPYILDGGKCKVGIESTIVGIEDNKVVIYRLGGITLEDIQKEIGTVEIKNHSTQKNIVQAPGQIQKHYAPKKTVLIGNPNELLNKFFNKKIILITFGKKNIPPTNNNTLVIYNLSENSDLIEAASRLFETLYLADASDADIIIAEPLPDKGLGKTINDRLKRAASKE